MIPGMNPRAMKQAMKKMGMTQVEINATEVIIKTSQGNDLKVRNPSVQKIVMMGQESLQISGEIEEVQEIPKGPSPEDIDTVAEQAQCSKEKAIQALEKSDGDLAQAIMDLQEEASQ